MPRSGVRSPSIPLGHPGQVIFEPRRKDGATLTPAEEEIFYRALK